jgi:hypothetical protein
VTANGGVDGESLEGLQMFDNGLGGFGFLEGELGMRVKPFVLAVISNNLHGLEIMLTELLVGR